MANLLQRLLSMLKVLVFVKSAFCNRHKNLLIRLEKCNGTLFIRLKKCWFLSEILVNRAESVIF